MYVTAALVGVWLVQKETDRKGLPITYDEIMNFAMIVIFAGIAGGRIYYVLFNWDFYEKFPAEIPQVWHGGLAIHGGLIGGGLAGWLYLCRRPVPFLQFADAVAPVIVLGQAFGRFGNFMNGDANGMPTTMAWGVMFPPASIAGQQFPGIATHPVMLYELFLNLIWFLVLSRLRFMSHRPGFLVCLYFVLYSVGRVAVSGFRADSLMLGSVRAAYVASAILILLFGGIILQGRLWKTETA